MMPDGSADRQAITFDVRVADGSISVRNFFNDPLTIADPVNQGHYQLGTFIDPASAVPADVPYYIEYIASTQYFIISLQQEPIGESRQQAEQFLLGHLGVDQTQLCRLNYTVGTPARVSVLHAGQNLGFSFCSGATQL
jgi:hypothetical protein